MDYFVLGLLFLLSGFIMKLSDDSYDIDSNLLIAIIFGVLCAIASGLAAISYVGAAYIFIAIIIGNLLVFKIDGIHHGITLIIFALLCLIFGLPNLSVIVLLILVLAAVSDEVGHELIGKITDIPFFNLFFEYRFAMKIVIFLLAICGVLSLWTFVFFIMFELAYLFAGIAHKKLN